MKQGRSLVEIGQELERQRKVRKDFIVDTKVLSMETDAGQSVLSLTSGNEIKRYLVNEVAHQQIASRLNIPYRYYQKMQKEYPELLDQNVNGWFTHNPERRMLRTLDGRVRAFLSNRYRRLDNLELCAAILPIINEMKSASIESCEVTESHMYLKVINKKLKAEVAVNDVVQAGFVVSNSEIGLGSLKVEPLVYRLVCKNGLICKDFSQKKYHVGRRTELAEDTAYDLYSDETLQADDRAFFMKVQDIIRHAVDESRFLLTVDKMREALHIPLKHDPVQEVELLADTYQLTQGERGDILRELFMGHDLSRYGMVNAVTAASKLAQSYDRATELERIGGDILASPVPMLEPRHVKNLISQDVPYVPAVPVLSIAEK